MMARHFSVEAPTVVLTLLVSFGACSSPRGSAPAAMDASPGDASGAEAAGGDARSDASPDAGAVRLWDWVGIVGTGQSLSVGAYGSPISARTQPYNNLKLALGPATVPPFDPTISGLSMAPLVEPIRALAQTYPSAYPANISGETPHTAMADQITAMFQQATGGGDYVTAHTVVGEDGQALSFIDKTATEMVTGAMSTGRAYAATLFEARAIARLASAANKTYGIGAIVITHGESDAGNTSYESGLYRIWSDYNQDLSASTGQSKSIPMFVSQQHSVPQGKGFTSASTLAQWRVGVDHHGDIVCAGPKYQYPYTSADNVHLLTQGYEELGEKFGEIFFEKVVLGRDWQPLQPIAASRAAGVVTVQFQVPVGPLAWDDTFPSPHTTGYPQWTAGRGFEVLRSGTPVTISSVAIVGDTVQITCSDDITTGTVVVGYAYIADGAPMPGGTARWGHLRDSDPFVGSTTHIPQPNYCVSFSMAVP